MSRPRDGGVNSARHRCPTSEHYSPANLQDLEVPVALQARQEPPEAAQCGGQGVDAGAGAALEAARRADTGQAPHQEAEIQTADAHHEALDDVGMAAQIHPAQPPGFVEMRVGAFEAFAATAQRSPAVRAPNPPPIGIHRVADLPLPPPAPPPARRLRHIAAQPEVRQRDQRLVAVIPLVADHFR